MVKAGLATALLNGLFCASVAVAAEGPPPVPNNDSPIRYGPFDIRPRIGAGVTYDDNIYINSTNRQADAIWTISPGVMVGAGDYRQGIENWMTLDYAPNFLLFTDQSANNAIDHDARLALQRAMGPLTLSLQQGVQAFSGNVADVGNRVNRQIYTTEAVAHYEFSPKTSAELTGRQQINDYNGFSDFNEWQFGGWVDYASTPKVKFGVGLIGGWLDVQNSANQQYQQLQARVTYSASEKVELSASAGGELREFDGGMNRATPVFSLGMKYKLREETTLSLDTYRRNQNSVSLANQNYNTTGVSAGVRHQFQEKYTAHLTAGYENADYIGTVGNAAARNDDYYFVRSGLDAKLIDHLTAGIFYQYRKNSSSLAGFGFYNHQVGVNVAFSY